jgi:hypothetical protein
MVEVPNNHLSSYAAQVSDLTSMVILSFEQAEN